MLDSRLSSRHEPQYNNDNNINRNPNQNQNQNPNQEANLVTRGQVASINHRSQENKQQVIVKQAKREQQTREGSTRMGVAGAGLVSQSRKTNITMSIPGGLLAVLSLSGLLLGAIGVSRAQCPEKTMTSFERIGGVTIKDGGAPLAVLYQANVSTSAIVSTLGAGASSAASVAAAAAAASSITPITAECNNRCRRSRTCRAFLVDYSRHICWSVEQIPSSSPPSSSFSSSSTSTPFSITSSNGQSSSSSSSSMVSSLTRAPIPIHLAPTSERTAYFEKVCLNLPLVECERAWIYERVMAYQLHGHDDKLIDDVPSRLKCQEYCLNEREFRCRSGEYDYLTMQCRLSSLDRHLKPAQFRPTSSNIDYFENQCVPIGNQCDAFDRFDDLDLGRAEIMRHANTSEQCQQFCTQTIKAFICRSFTWSPLTGRCYLNSANTQMVGGVDRLVPAPGLVYYQRNDCIDLKLECDTASMTLNLRTSEPFRGRMYVRDEPNACETQGRSALISSLSIPFQTQGARCATRELPSRYSSVVVVQQHPLIQRKSDRYIKLVCDFQTANKTIMSSYNVMSNPWTSTALINATSFAPKIRLRITDKFGNDITGAKLGDELQLRIEAESESVYDMVARSVLARSGTTDESIVLIDHDGCPADYRIFPPLKKMNKRTIIGRFDAFKFSSDVVVRFQVDVQFCLNSCPAPNCPIATALLESSQQQQQQQQQSLLNTAGGVVGQQQQSQQSQQQQQHQNLAAGSANSANLFNVNTQQLPGDSMSQPSPTQATLGQQQLASSTSTTSTTSTTMAPSSLQHNNLLPLASISDLEPSGLPAAAGDQNIVAPGRPSLANSGSNLIYSQMGRPPVNQPQQQQQQQQSPDSTSENLGQNFDNGSQSQSSSAQARQMASSNNHHHQHHHHQFRQQYGNQLRGDYAQIGGQQQELGGAELAAALNQAEQQQDQNAHRARRRRRRSAAAEPISAAETRHVPLQREIIVMESSPSSSASSSASKAADKDELTASGQKTKHHQLKTSNLGPAASSKSTKASKQTFGGQQAATMSAAGEQQFRLDNNNNNLEGKQDPLVCTTWSSLIFSMFAFCALQLITLGVCLVTWIRRSGSGAGGNSKVLTTANRTTGAKQFAPAAGLGFLAFENGHNNGQHSQPNRLVRTFKTTTTAMAGNQAATRHFF